MELRDNQDTLIERARQGDSRAFEILAGECRGELEKYIHARVGDHLRSRMEPEDVLQETCTRAWGSIQGIQWAGTATFVRWMKGIANHVILQSAERLRRGEWLYLEDVRHSEDPSPSRVLRREERLDRLQDAVNRLPKDYRDAVLLVRIDGLRIQEAAERMGRTPKAVLHLLSRALKRLKELIGDTESLGLPEKRLHGGERNGTGS